MQQLAISALRRLFALSNPAFSYHGRKNPEDAFMITKKLHIVKEFFAVFTFFASTYFSCAKTAA